ncbi:hypothetical protein F4808DRAFT_455590 [Astrocystis sublimbata]|nr:hypothetical protein F4808DRAFT_455590 [Astrocystis sublimbata]
MAKKRSLTPSEAGVRDAMMSDLGNHRNEDFITDEKPKNRPRPQREDWQWQQAASILKTARTKASTRPNSSTQALTRPSSSTQAWKAAAASGFDDDDAAAVKGLDQLDNGNSHRLSSSGQTRSDSHRSTNSGPKPTGHTYNPGQPTYPRGPKKPRLTVDRSTNGTSRHSSTSNKSPHVSPLGGIIPDGGEVKRWDSARVSKKARIENPMLGRPTSQPPMPQDRSTLTTDGGHGRNGHIPNPLNMNGTRRDDPTQRTLESVGRGPVPSAQHEQTQVTATHSTTHGSMSATDSKPQLQKAGESPTDNFSWVPPHLRKMEGDPSPSSQIPIRTQPTPLSTSSETLYNETTLGWPVQDEVALETKRVVEKADLSGQTSRDISFDLGQFRQQKVDLGQYSGVPSEQKASEVESDLIQFPQPESDQPSLREAESRKPATEPNRFIDEPQLDTSPITCATAELPSVPTKLGADGLARMGSGWSDSNEVSSIDLMSFSPDRKPKHPGKDDYQFRRDNDHPNDASQADAVNHEGLMRMSKVLQHSFGSQYPLDRDATYMACFLHLVEKEEFMAQSLDDQPTSIEALYKKVCGKEEFMTQSLDDQKTSIEALHKKVYGKDARTVLKPEVLYRLRPKDTECPKAVMEHNAMVSLGNGKRSGSPPAPQPSDKAPSGLMRSRWASDKPSNTELQSKSRGEHIPAHYSSASFDPENPDTTCEHSVDGVVSSHRRSTTNDTITDLAQLMGFLTM